MLPEELSVGDLTDTNQESVVMKRMKMPLTKTLTLKDISKVFRDIESLKGKILEADVTFQRIMAIHQGREKMPSPVL